MNLSDFDFYLPKQLIAKYPALERTSSRLMVLDGGQIGHHRFHEIIQFVQPDDLLIFNDTKVIPARLYGKKMSGGKVELLVERILDDRRLLAQLHVNRKPRCNEVLHFERFELIVINQKAHLYELYYAGNEDSLYTLIDQYGEMPLPPYLQRRVEPLDRERYQTVYAQHNGSVAAPTAGLHFDQTLLNALQQKGVAFGFLTLHIGAGTFTPVRTDVLQDHRMHSEYLEISESLCQQINTTKARGGRIIAVGTTALRALETARQSGFIHPYQGETDIFIYPGFNFHCVDALITNFHLPRSTLLMLVCAFGGQSYMMQAYQHAIQANYHFYSYGDAMLITKVSNEV